MLQILHAYNNHITKKKKLLFVHFFLAVVKFFFLAVVFIINWCNFDAYNVSNKVVSDSIIENGSIFK